LGLLVVANAARAETIIVASVDSEAVSASGLTIEHKRDMPDFTVTYLRGPHSEDVIGIYDGAHPSTFSSEGKRLGAVRDNIASQPVTWTCWTKQEEGEKLFGAEVLVLSRRIVAGEEKTEFRQHFHVFIIHGDLKSLAEARKLAARLIKNGPNKAPEPTPGAVTPRATEGISR
jgi:hypothetical protein